MMLDTVCASFLYNILPNLQEKVVLKRIDSLGFRLFWVAGGGA